MIWNKPQANSTHHHSENVSTDIVDVMRSQLVAEPEVGVGLLQHQLQQAATALRQQLVTETCHKSSINESYYNLDKVLS